MISKLLKKGGPKKKKNFKKIVRISFYPYWSSSFRRAICFQVEGAWRGRRSEEGPEACCQGQVARHGESFKEESINLFFFRSFASEEYILRNFKEPFDQKNISLLQEHFNNYCGHLVDKFMKKKVPEYRRQSTRRDLLQSKALKKIIYPKREPLPHKISF